METNKTKIGWKTDLEGDLYPKEEIIRDGTALKDNLEGKKDEGKIILPRVKLSSAK